MILGQPLWYWALLALAAVMLLAGPACSWLERRDEKRNRDLWSTLPGAVPTTDHVEARDRVSGWCSLPDEDSLGGAA